MKRLALVIPLLIISAWGRGLFTRTGTLAEQGEPACSGHNFPITLGGTSSCCPLDEGEIWHIGPHGELAHRYLGKACTTKTIGAAQVSIGPCGGGRDPAEDPNWLMGHDTKIFKPVSKPQVCGYQVTKPDNSISFFPEGYTAQPLYPGVAAACPFTLCKDVGIPGVLVTVVLSVSPNVMPGSSPGSVHSDPPGITLSSAGQASGPFSGDVTLIAEPTDKHVRALFSGDCTKAGEHGQRAECIVKLAPDPKVTVTFECQNGSTCGKAGAH